MGRAAAKSVDSSDSSSDSRTHNERSFGEEKVKSTSRVSGVRMSRDGKKFSFSSNFDTPSGLAKFETAAEVALLHADDKPCIYEYKSKNSNDQIVVTGCENEIREMQIQRKNSAPFYGKIHPDGKVDEIELPPKEDEVLYPDDYA